MRRRRRAPTRTTRGRAGGARPSAPGARSCIPSPRPRPSVGLRAAIDHVRTHRRAIRPRSSLPIPLLPPVITATLPCRSVTCGCGLPPTGSGLRPAARAPSRSTRRGGSGSRGPPGKRCAGTGSSRTMRRRYSTCTWSRSAAIAVVRIGGKPPSTALDSGAPSPSVVTSATLPPAAQHHVIWRSPARVGMGKVASRGVACRQGVRGKQVRTQSPSCVRFWRVCASSSEPVGARGRCSRCSSASRVVSS